MAKSLQDDLPDSLRQVQTRPLFVMHLDVRPLQVIGATPGGYQRVGIVPGGVVEGERLSGRVLDGGADWQHVRSDGSTTLDVRLVLETLDGALIGMTYRGIRHGAPDVIALVDMRGSTMSSRSASAIAAPMARCTAFSRFSKGVRRSSGPSIRRRALRIDRRPHGTPQGRRDRAVPPRTS